MKKLLFLAIIAILSINVANAQSVPTKVYCELVGTQKFMSAKVTVQVDFGQDPNTNSKLVDENGKKITFNSMVDAMNYMGKLGWEFEAAYVITTGSGATAQNVYHWLLSKYISDDDNISDGFTTKGQFKDMQRAQEAQQE